MSDTETEANQRASTQVASDKWLHFGSKGAQVRTRYYFATSDHLMVDLDPEGRLVGVFWKPARLELNHDITSGMTEGRHVCILQEGNQGLTINGVKYAMFGRQGVAIWSEPDNIDYIPIDKIVGIGLRNPEFATNDSPDSSNHPESVPSPGTI